MVKINKIIGYTLSTIGVIGILTLGSCKQQPIPIIPEVQGYLNSLSNTTLVSPGEDVEFTANIDFIDGVGTDTLHVDPDGRSNPLPAVQKSISVNGPATLDEVVSANMPNEGTFTPEAMLESDGNWVSGNTITVSSSMTDTTPPTIGLSIDSYTQDLGEQFTVRGNASDPESGIGSMEYSLNGGAWQSYTNGSDLDLTLNSRGDHTLSFKATNGNSLETIEDYVINVVNYKPVESISTDNSGAMGTIDGSFYNPADSDTSEVKVYASYFNSDLETLLTNGDATLVDTVSVTGAGNYDFDVEQADGLQENATVHLYFAPEDRADKAEQATEITAGMPNRFFNYLVTFTGETLADGTQVDFKDKYGNVIETKGTASNMVGGLMQNVADDVELYVEVQGHGQVDSFTVQNKVNYIDTIDL
jgi:hypothetical protein